MLIIEYDSVNGEVVSDGKVREWADRLVKVYKDRKSARNLTVIVGSVLMVDMTRLLVMKGKLNHEEIVYRFRDLDQSPDKYGTLRTWPKGFCDLHNDILTDLIS